MSSLLKASLVCSLSARSSLSHISRFSTTSLRYKQDDENSQHDSRGTDERAKHYPNTPAGIMERTKKPGKIPVQPVLTPYPPHPGGKNPKTGEVGGPGGPEPTRFGDWERKGRVTDF